MPLVTVWASVSLFVQVTVSLVCTVICLGIYHCLGPSLVMSISGFAEPCGIITLNDFGSLDFVFMLAAYALLECK
jgi:hypothetical protein